MNATDERVSMEPQCFCARCGRSFGGPNKRFHVDGRILQYPEGMDFHHVDGHHQGPGVFIGHECCHMPHHDGRAPLEFPWRDGRWYSGPRGGRMLPMTIASEWDTP